MCESFGLYSDCTNVYKEICKRKRFQWYHQFKLWTWFFERRPCQPLVEVGALILVLHPGPSLTLLASVQEKSLKENHAYLQKVMRWLPGSHLPPIFPALHVLLGQCPLMNWACVFLYVSVLLIHIGRFIKLEIFSTCPLHLSQKIY